MITYEGVNEVSCEIRDKTSCILRYVDPYTREQSLMTTIDNVATVISPSEKTAYDHDSKKFGIYTTQETYICDVIPIEKVNMISCRKQ